MVQDGWMEGSEVIVGIICLAMIVGFGSACIALLAGYSVFMALGFYTLFGCVTAMAAGSVGLAASVTLRALRERDAQPRQTH